MRGRAAAKDDSTRQPSARATPEHSQAKINAVLAMDMDYKPFFYSGPGGGESGETLVVACANGQCVRLHVSSRSMDPPTRVWNLEKTMMISK